MSSPDNNSGSDPPADLVIYLLAGMAAGTFTAAVLSVLGSFLVAEFDISRAELGLVVALNTIAGGLLSPAAGRFTDRVGGGVALQALFYLAAAAFLITAVAPSYTVLLAGALVGGAAQALANPATNKIIAYRYRPSRRANVTGIKQSGVQFAIFFGGVTLPSLAGWLGWRWAVAVTAILAIAAGAVLHFDRKGRSAGAGDFAPGDLGSFRGSVSWLAAYGLLIGFSGSALFFLPLFASEELGQSVEIGGLALSVAGVTAVVGRVAWARFAERGSRYRLTLGILAGLAVVGAFSFTMADTERVFLWIGAVLVGASSSSWNSVGMLAVIDGVVASGAGSASGRVLFGFLVGLGVGPPLYGQTFDATGSYQMMWVIAAVVAGLALLLMIAWRDHERRGTPAAA